MIQPPNISVLLFLVAASLLEQQGVPRMISKNHGYWSCTLLAASGWEKSCTRHQSIHINALTICKLQSRKIVLPSILPQNQWDEIDKSRQQSCMMLNYVIIHLKFMTIRCSLKLTTLRLRNCYKGVNLVFQTTNFFDGFYSRKHTLAVRFRDSYPLIWRWQGAKARRPAPMKWHPLPCQRCVLLIEYKSKTIQSKTSGTGGCDPFSTCKLHSAGHGTQLSFCT